MIVGLKHNLMAINTARNLSQAYGLMAQSTRRLSSGLRVGIASDDAAGLSVREIMRAEVISLNQGIRNANDAISVLQTADGALSVIDEKLIRMKELAMQASTGTYSSDQRLIIDSEYQAMASEITRIASATDFNGVHLLNGNLSGADSSHNGNGMNPTGPMKIHFGTGNDCAEDYYYIQIGTATASALGLRSPGALGSGPADGATISTQSLAQRALTILDRAIISKDSIRAHLGSIQVRLQNTIANLQVQNMNMQAAESQISDVDVSTEMTAYTRQQIITQAAVAMLSQANNLPRMALQLIGA